MPIQVTIDRYKCEYCGKEYDTVAHATDCEVDHDIIYIGLSRHDLRALWNFLATGQVEYVTSSLERTLRRYNKTIGRV